MKTPFVYLLVSLATLACARALVVDDTTTLNSAPPANGAPWYNVGAGGGASAVYLKRGWVVSARHVFGGTTSPQVNFGGTIYSGGTIYVLANPDVSSTPSDVVLFNIGSTVPLNSSEIGIVTETPASGADFTMIGYGCRRTGGLVKGNSYTWDDIQGVNKSWGLNTRNATDPGYVSAGANSFVSFLTTFTANGSSGTAQAAVGDSGGAVFMAQGNLWQLAGTMNGISQAQGNMATDGDITAIASLYSYAKQINPRLNSLTPPPTLSTVSPSHFAAANNPQTLTFSGSNFTNGAIVQMATSADYNNFNNTPNNAVFVSSTSLTVSISAQSPANWKFRVVNPDGQPSAAMTVDVVPQTFSNWLAGYPSLTGSNAQPTANPDGDSLNNLQEYAFGSDPTSASSVNAPVSATETVSSQPYLTLVYDRDLTKTDLTFQPQTTTDLTANQAWTNVPDTLISTSGTIEHRKASVPLDGTARFLRLKITR